MADFAVIISLPIQPSSNVSIKVFKKRPFAVRQTTSIFSQLTFNSQKTWHMTLILRAQYSCVRSRLTAESFKNG